MAIAQGDAPTLKKIGFAGVVETNKAILFDNKEFQLQQLFTKGNGGNMRLVNSEKIVEDIERDIRTDGTWQSQPGRGKQFLHTQIGEIRADVLFQEYVERIPPNLFTQVRAAGDPNLPAADVSEAMARQWVAKKVTKISTKGARLCLRNLEIWCKNILSNPFNYALTIDKASRTITTNIQAGVPSAPWSTASTDAYADWARFIREFVDQAGVRPTHVIYSNRLTDYLALNVAIRDAEKRQGRDGSITTLPLALVPEGGEITPIECSGFYQDAAGATQRFWPDLQMTFIALHTPEDVLDMVTVPTEANDFKGGMHSYEFRDERSRDRWVMINHNAAPLLLDASMVRTYDLSTSTPPTP